MQVRSRFRSVGPARRRTGVVLILIAAAALVPAAIAFACGPNRQVQADRLTYSPGQTVTVTGSNGWQGAKVTFSLEPGGELGTVTVPESTSFSFSFAAPTAPGAYTLVNEAVDQNGQAISGGARQSFTVEPADEPAPQPGPSPGAVGPAPAGSPAVPGASTPAQTGVTTPVHPSTGVAQPGSGSKVPSEQVPEKATGKPSSGGARGEPARGPGEQSAGITERAGRSVFTGSIPRQDRLEDVATAAQGSSGHGSGTHGKGGGKVKLARPSEDTAGADIWSTFGSSKNPSLVPDDDSGEPEARTGAALTWGLALLGLGLLVLVGGLGVHEARRRRAQAS